MCPSPDGRGFLVAPYVLPDTQREQRALERHGPPWSGGANATSCAIGPYVTGLVLNDSGRYLAAINAAGGARVAIWDTQENKLIAEVSHGDPVN
jgi:hypothetical protein